MKTEELVDKAVKRKKIDALVKAKEAALKEKLGPFKAKLKTLDTEIATVINKSGEKGTLKSFKLPDDSLVYAAESDKYSTRDRTEVDDWVLEPLLNQLDTANNLLREEVVDGENDPDMVELLEADVDVLEDIIKQVRHRLGIFSNSVVKDSCIAYRKDTGATDVEGSLVGGKLPGGVRMYKDVSVNFRKG